MEKLSLLLYSSFVKLALEQNFFPLIIGGDSSCVIQWVSPGIAFPWKLADYLEAVLDLVADDSVSLLN